MLTPLVQRWRGGRASYQPAGEPIDPRRYEVAAIRDDTTARDYVVGAHYSRSYPAAVHRFGLYRGGHLVGASVFSVPTNYEALACLPGARDERADLGRFVLDPDVEANGESWFLGRCFELLRREGLAGVMSYSDPEPRSDLQGRVVFGGHVGTIYQATNGVYLGRATARTQRLLPDGTVLSPRALQKIRAGESGWRYAAAQLERFGADTLAAGADRRAWLAHWLPQLTRPFRHPGNHRYAWALRPCDRRFLPRSLAYPKIAQPQLRLMLDGGMPCDNAALHRLPSQTPPGPIS